MIDLCIYQLVYLVAIAIVGFRIFVSLCFYFLKKKDKIKLSKQLTFHFVEMIVIGTGILFSEYLIDMLNIYNCSGSEKIAFISMFLCIPALLYFKRRHQASKAVFTEKIDKFLAYIVVGLLVMAILIFILEGLY